MIPNFRFSSREILIVSLSIIGIVGAIGFVNNSYADNSTMKTNMTTHSNMTMKTNKTMAENMTMNGNMSTSNNTNKTPTPPPPPKLLSPVAQVKSGIAPSQVKCGDGYSLILNLFNSRPACIKSADITNFISRGWGHAVT